MEMTFVVSGNRKSDLRKLTKLLFSAFPGLTVYEHMNASDAVRCVKTHRVDAVFIDGAWDASDEFRLLCGLRQSHADLPIYMFAENDQYEEDALWNEATGYLVRPEDADELRSSILSAASLA